MCVKRPLCWREGSRRCDIVTCRCNGVYCSLCWLITPNDDILATPLRWDLGNLRFHESGNICIMSANRACAKGTEGQGNNGWFDRQQDGLSLQFDKSGMCCVISCTFPASCCPCITLKRTTCVKLTCSVLFLLLTWPDSPLSFSLYAADGNS